MRTSRDNWYLWYLSCWGLLHICMYIIVYTHQCACQILGALLVGDLPSHLDTVKLGNPHTKAEWLVLTKKNQEWGKHQYYMYNYIYIYDCPLLLQIACPLCFPSGHACKDHMKHAWPLRSKAPRLTQRLTKGNLGQSLEIFGNLGHWII